MCKFEFCKGFTCCTKLKKKDQCTRIYDSYIKFVGNSCTDKYTGRPGTCIVDHQCQELWQRSPNNVTWCGYDCCAPVACCPEKEASQIGISETSKFVFMCKKYIHKILDYPLKCATNSVNRYLQKHNNLEIR